MNVKFIKSPEKKQIVEKLSQQFGIQELNYLLIRTGKEKIRAYSGSLSKDELIELSKIVNIELIGTYLLKDEHDMQDLRLSFDAPIILKEQITKNIVEINEAQFNDWIHGRDLEIKNTMPHHTLKGVVCKGARVLDAQGTNSILKDGVFVKFLDIKTEKGTVVIKYHDDFIGCGKSNGEKIFNYVPKDRRLRK